MLSVVTCSVCVQETAFVNKERKTEMKKVMMTAFAVVLAAGMASAANIDWNVARNFVGSANPVFPGSYTGWGTGENQIPGSTSLSYALVL